MPVEVVPATLDQQPVLANLLQLYAHDFSEFHEVEVGPDGGFEYPKLPLYWLEPDRHPFLVKSEGKLAGFALVKRGSELTRDQTTWDMAEFFVLRAYRRRGIGAAIAHEIWRRFPGKWEVRVMEANRSALQFWERAISQFTGRPSQASSFQKDGKLWRVFSFEAA